VGLGAKTGGLAMNGYYWKAKNSEWFWRENKKAENWQGPFNSFKAAKQSRARHYDRIAKRAVVIDVSSKPVKCLRCGKPIANGAYGCLECNWGGDENGLEEIR
jgi:hypothetical protein